MNFANYVDFAARNAPDSPAVADRSESSTFRELSADSDRIANALESHGVDVGDRVAVHLPNGVPFVRAYFGVMKAGGIPIPINTRFTDEQIEYVLTDGDAVAVITDGESEPDTDRAVCDRWDVADLRADGEADYDVTPRRDEELAALLYTSGTTGAPKGVFHTHGNLDANAKGFIRYNEWSRDDVALTVCQCFHVTGLNITTTPFLVLEAENHLLAEWSPTRVLEAIERHRVTYTFLIPTMVMELLDHDEVHRHDLSSLHTIAVGGAPMPKRRIAAVEETFDCLLLEGYGMTETTPLAAFNRPTTAGRRVGSVGQVAAEAVEVRIEDPRTGEPVAPGERGELLWRGQTVTPAYNKPQLTETKFVERETIAASDGSRRKRWLRSGDIGWMDDDGFLFVVDRREDMFTTGCGDVSPREIEDVIYAIEPVEKVAIIDTKDDVRGATVTAIVACRAGASVSKTQIKRACERELRSHEVPDRVEFVDEIPQTATGKIDRSTLRDRFN